MREDPRKRIVLIEDHLVVRTGLRMLLDSRSDIKVVGEAASREESIDVAMRERPDVFLVDLNLGKEVAVDFIGELLGIAPEARVVLLTGITDREQVLHAIIAGAMGLVYKDEAVEVLVHAIRKVHAGEAWLSRSLTAAVLSRLSRTRPPNVSEGPESNKIGSLTRREREVIVLIAGGSDRKTTAEQLFISEATVRNHLTSILGKLDLQSRFDLIFYAQRHGLVDGARRAGAGLGSG